MGVSPVGVHGPRCAYERAGRRDRALGRRHERRAARARLPEAAARQLAVAAGRAHLRHVRGCADRDDGGARPARRARGVHARPPAARRLPAAAALAAAAERAPRLRAAGDARASGCSIRTSLDSARGGADRAGRLRHRRLDEDDDGGHDSYELAYSSHETPPETMAQAVLASAAISALVLPLPVGDRIATDGGWVRNFPLGPASTHPDVDLIVAFRHVPQLPAHRLRALDRLRAPAEPLPRRPAGPRPDRRARRGGGARARAASRSTSAT